MNSFMFSFPLYLLVQQGTFAFVLTVSEIWTSCIVIKKARLSYGEMGAKRRQTFGLG